MPKDLGGRNVMSRLVAWGLELQIHKAAVVVAMYEI